MTNDDQALQNHIEQLDAAIEHLKQLKREAQRVTKECNWCGVEFVAERASYTICDPCKERHKYGGALSVRRWYVYVWKDGDRIIYIGNSRQPHRCVETHGVEIDALRARAGDNFSVELMDDLDADTAAAVETAMIALLRPPGNRPRPSRRHQVLTGC